MAGNVLHPWLEKRIGQSLDGKVSLAQLSLSWGQVDVSGSRGARPEGEASAANRKIHDARHIPRDCSETLLLRAVNGRERGK